jgi:N-acetylmuramoyl-L-alanine amidase
MNIEDCLLTKATKCGRNCVSMVPKGIVVHYVGNPGSSALGNRNYFENGSGGLGVSSHYIIGLSGEIIRCIPDCECAAHAGVSYGSQWNEMAKTNNSKYIGIECCHPSSDGKFNDYTIDSLIELVTDLCIRYNLDPEKDVYRHYDVTGKSCPLYYTNKPTEWTALKNKIKNNYNQVKAAKTDQANAPSTWADQAWTWAKSNNLNDGTRPKDPTTREEVANILHKTYQLILKTLTSSK